MRDLFHYLLSLGILALYGGRVCPFLESLTAIQLIMPLAVALTLQWLLRRALLRWWVTASLLERQVRRVLELELGLFLVSGIAVALFNTLVYGFPPVSGLKVVVGFCGLGFFVALDLALQWERRLARHIQERQLTIQTGPNYFPVSRKLGLVASVTALLTTAVLFLVVNKDLIWLLEVNGTVSLSEAQHSILKEFAFVSLVILGEVLNLIRSYARNLRFFFDTENRVLTQTNQGDLNGRVAVSTNDEFGIMAHQTNLMVDAIRARTQEIQCTRDVTILTLASLAETRDNETGAHILRTQRYVRALAAQLADQPGFREVLDEETIELLYKSAPLHDIGKVGIPDAILLKPAKLTDDEFEIMKTHAQLGADAIRVAERELGSTSFLRYGREIAETHHERWDGSGYPHGLQGENIPISGRLMALADVYDALISKRIYKPAFSHERARTIILESSGSHFDPAVVTAFVAIDEEFQEIAANFQDEAYGSRRIGGSDA